MKRILALVIAASVSFAANASHWVEFSPEMHLLFPAEGGSINAMASMNKGKVVINLIDTSGQMCKKGSDSGIIPAGVFRVNGTMVKFVQACINGTRILSPETEKGKEFFRVAITSAPAVVSVGYARTLNFKSEDFDSVKKAMSDVDSAL